MLQTFLEGLFKKKLTDMIPSFGIEELCFGIVMIGIVTYFICAISCGN